MNLMLIYVKGEVTGNRKAKETISIVKKGNNVTESYDSNAHRKVCIQAGHCSLQTQQNTVTTNATVFLQFPYQ